MIPRGASSREHSCLELRENPGLKGELLANTLFTRAAGDALEKEYFSEYVNTYI